MQRRLAVPVEQSHNLRPGLSLIIGIAAATLFVGQIPFVINFFWSLRSGEVAGENPWNATTLEWACRRRLRTATSRPSPRVFRGPYEYSVPGHKTDYWPQDEAA